MISAVHSFIALVVIIKCSSLFHLLHSYLSCTLFGHCAFFITAHLQILLLCAHHVSPPCSTSHIYKHPSRCCIPIMPFLLNPLCSTFYTTLTCTFTHYTLYAPSPHTLCTTFTHLTLDNISPPLKYIL